MPISIVMPTYNGMAYLEQAIESVLSQNYQDWELIVSDDGSKDDTREYLASIRDPRVKVHFQPKNLGIFGNMNFLFSQVRYDLTQILCQDDYFVDPSALDRLLATWSALPQEIAFLRANHSHDTQCSLTRYQASVLPSIVDPEHSDLFFFVFGCIPGNLTNVSVRTEVVAAVGGFRPDLPSAGDFEFWSRVGRSRPWAISEISVTHARSHQGQASKYLNDKGELLPQMREVLQTLYTELTRKGYEPADLRLMATASYTSLQRDKGVKVLLKGYGTHFLQGVHRELDLSRFSFGWFGGWLIYLGTLGGRVFRVSCAKRLLSRHAHQAVRA